MPDNLDDEIGRALAPTKRDSLDDEIDTALAAFDAALAEVDRRWHP